MTLLHVVLGLVGMGFARYVQVQLKAKNLTNAILFSWAAFASFVLSWYTGGVTYLVRYPFIKKFIKEGSVPWTHGIFMEVKEHIFLFLPFLNALLLFVLYNMKKDSKISHWAAADRLAFLLFFIGVLVALLGGGVYFGKVVSLQY